MRSLLCSVILVLSLLRPAAAAPLQIRVATYNSSLNRASQGELIANLSTTTDAQARQVAEILQRVRPDIVLINEFDYDAQGQAADLFAANYLGIGQNGQAPLTYPYKYVPPSNTGIASGFDLDNDGATNTTIPVSGAATATKDRYGNDSFGFGWFPGQYGFVVFSKFPIQASAIRTFQKFLWKDMPNAVLPDNSSTLTPKDWYSSAELAVFRLSSKNHCDIPIEVAPGQILHLLASHPTPPSFDSTEDRNGRRNRDEIRLWADYINNATYLYDDANRYGGIGDNQRFVILGDLNADPLDGDSFQAAVTQLTSHPLINNTMNPSSLGGPQQSTLQGGVNASHKGNPAHDTADFNDTSVGNLRVDHVLPSKLGLNPTGGGVFWPLNTDATFALVSASDHRLVYLDVEVTPIPQSAVRNLSISKQPNSLVLNWQTQPSVTYSVEEALSLGDWSPAAQVQLTLTPETQGATAVVPASGAFQKFYRVACSIDVPISAPLVDSLSEITSSLPFTEKVRTRKLRRSR